MILRNLIKRTNVVLHLTKQRIREGFKLLCAVKYIVKLKIKKIMSHSQDLKDLYKPDELCKNCISSLKIKGRERKIKCCNINSPFYNKIINRSNVCDFYECEDFLYS